MKSSIITFFCLLLPMALYSQTIEDSNENGYFFSKEFREGYLKEISNAIGIELSSDSSSLNLLSRYGVTLQNDGEMEAALDLFQLVHDFSLFNQDEINLALAYNNIGAVRNSEGNFELALLWYHKALTLEERLELNKQLASTFNNIGVVYDNKGAFDEALAWYHKAKKIQEHLDLKEELSGTFNNIGVIYDDQGDFDKALTWYRRAMDIQEELNLEVKMAISYSNIATVYYSKGEYDKALHWNQKALKIRDNLDMAIPLATTYNNLGTILVAKGLFNEALKWYHKSKDIRDSLKLLVSLTVSHNNIGAVYYYQGNFDEALIWYNKAKIIRDSLNLDILLAESFHNIGEVYHSKGNLDEAIEWHKKAKEIRIRLHQVVDLAGSYNNLGAIYGNKGEFQVALGWLDKAKIILDSLKLNVALAITFDNFGTIYNEQGNFEEALIWYNKAKEINEKLDLEVSLADSYNNIGAVYSSYGKFYEALKWFDRARVIQDSLNLDVDLARSYNNIGYIYSSQGNLDEALKWYLKAMDIRENLDLKVDLARSYFNLGAVYRDQKDFQEALEWFDKAKDIRKNLDLKVDLAESYNSIGAVNSSLGKLEQALIWHNKAKIIQEELSLEVDLAVTYNNIGDIHYSNGKYDEALQWANKSKEIFEGLNHEIELGLAYNNIGTIFSTKGNSEKAIFWYRKARGLQKMLNLEVNLATSYYNLGSEFFGMEQLDSALNYSQKNIQLNEIIRKLNKGNTNRQVFTKRSLEAVEIGILSAFLTDQPGLAFSFSEKGKSRGLLDLLSEQKIERKSIPEKLSVKLLDNENQLKVINQNLATNIPIIKRKNLISLRDSLFKLQKELQDQIKVYAPEFANLIYPETAEKEQIQSILNQQEVLVSYFIGRATTFAFIISSSEINMIDLGPSDSISKLLDQFRKDFILSQRNLLSSGQPKILQQAALNKNFFRLSSQLYQKLWAPVDSTNLLNGKDIILVPDGFLNYLPFELLIKDEKQQDYQNYQYLVKEHAISYYPSATVLHFERIQDNSKFQPPKDFLGLAITNFDEFICTQDGKTLGKLVGTKNSVQRMQVYFDPDRSDSKFDEEANEADFKKLPLSNYRYIHISTHGLIDQKTPEFSSIVLKPGGENDGCLKLYEIFNLELNADLVTLSACETGLGKLVKGEGMVGFTRALMYAGTPSVILSLWEVADQSSKDLFIKYYSILAKESGQKYKPLRNAQLEMIASEYYANPYFWAPFVFIGEKVTSF